METWDAITARRNVRVFEDRAIDDADLERILEAGRRAPSSRNWQPWDFVVVRERARLVELARVWRGAGSVAQSAATVALIAPVLPDEMQRDWAQFDTGQAMMSMQIAAADLGIGSGHSAIGDQDLLRSLLGVPEDRFAVALLPLGYPAERPLAPIENPRRRPFSEVVHLDRWCQPGA
jgi:nitroreductase